MAYETTVGWTQLLFEVTLTGTPSTIYDLLSPADIAEIAAVNNACGSNNLVVLDGFVFSDETFDVRHKVGGAAETFAKRGTALFPFVDWHKKALISGSGAALVKLIMGFTKLPS